MMTRREPCCVLVEGQIEACTCSGIAHRFTCADPPECAGRIAWSKPSSWRIGSNGREQFPPAGFRVKLALELDRSLDSWSLIHFARNAKRMAHPAPVFCGARTEGTLG